VRLNGNKIEKDFPQTRSDFNAIAQGYTADKVSEYFKSLNINSHIVDIGGEVFAADKKPDGQKWRVAIEEPSDSIDAPREYKSFIKLENQAIVTSGSYRKFIIEDGVKYSHTINPKTGEAIKHNLLSVSVTAKNATAADAIATAFMAMGMDKAKEFIVKNPEYGAFFIFCDDKGKTKTCATKQIESLIEIVE
jgi:thiamine biosynthesis lipoprotein